MTTRSARYQRWISRVLAWLCSRWGCLRRKLPGRGRDMLLHACSPLYLPSKGVSDMSSLSPSTQHLSVQVRKRDRQVSHDRKATRTPKRSTAISETRERQRMMQEDSKGCHDLRRRVVKGTAVEN